MSQEPRRSSRPSSVIKREELEGKLAKRKEEAELKVLKSRSRALENTRREELESFEREARRLSELVDEVFDDSDSDKSSNPNLSLEWDTNDCSTSPSFVTIESSLVSPLVQEIIGDILNSSVSQGEEEDIVPPEEAVKAQRRNTSTDNNFLASSPVGRDRPVHFNWPPRYPSQEPEDYSDLHYPPLQPRLPENTEVEEEGKYLRLIKKKNLAAWISLIMKRDTVLLNLLPRKFNVSRNCSLPPTLPASIFIPMNLD